MNITDPVANPPGSREIGFDPADHPNASAILFDNLARNPDAPALLGPGGTLTYRELCRQACHWGHAFSQFGLQRGERIAFFLDDTPTYPAAFFGAVRAGFVPVLLNTLTTPDTLQYLLADTGARIAVCEAELATMFNQETIAGSPLEQLVIANGSADVTAIATTSAEAFTAGQADDLPCANTGPFDMAFWMYSSGSTGQPKGIVHLHHDMAYSHLSFAANIVGLQPGDICFSVPKVFFAYGFGNSITFPFSVGAASILMPGQPRPERVLDMIETYRPTVFFGLPTLYTALCRSEGAEARDFSSLKYAFSAAETLSEEIATAWQSLTGLQAIEGLGSTEMLHIYLSNNKNERRHGSAGKRVPGYEIKLCDDQGQLAAAGEEGVMWVRGHSSAPLYWNQPQKTEATMHGDWIYTSDRFTEREGFYYFQGRADDLVKISGQWVWPLEVERSLAEHPHIHECAVIAHQLSDLRMTLRAFVCLRAAQQGDAAQTKDLQAYVKGQLLPHKYPRQVIYLQELPKTGTGKIDRQALAQHP